MNNFLPVLSQEQFKQLPEIVQMDFTLNYEKLSRFVVQNDLCKRYIENERAILTDKEIRWLALIVKERTLLITSQVSPLYRNVNPEILLLGNSLFEKISNQLTINNSKLESHVKLIKKKPQSSTASVKIIRNRITELDFKSFLISSNSPEQGVCQLADSNLEKQVIRDSQKAKNQTLPLKKRKLDLEPNPISKKYTAQTEGLESLQTKTNTNNKKDEVYLNPLPTKYNSINWADFGCSDEETPEVISDIEESIENLSPTEKLNIPNFNLQTSDTGMVTPEFYSEEETSDINHILTPRSSAEKETPNLISMVEGPDFISTNTNEVPRHAIIFDESLIVTAAQYSKNNAQSSDNSVKKQDVGILYNRAKKDLVIIHKTFQKESRLLDQFIYDTNYYSFKPEEKAIKSLQEIFQQGRASTYYFSKSSMEMSLKAVRIELEFINVYLLNELMFNDQIAILEKCKDACSTILSSKTEKSENFKNEARDLNDSIKNNYLPITHFNFAVYNFKKINNKVLVAIENESLASFDELITDLEKSVTYLQNAYKLLKNSKHDAELSIIVNFLAKSYEDLADFKNKKVDLMLEQNQNDDSLLNLLKEIKSNYHESYSYINDQQVWLSILYTQHRLIEAYTDNKNNINYVKEGLNETINLVDGLIKKGLSESEALSTNLELLYYMLYACSKASSLTNPASNEFQQTALNFMKLHIDNIRAIDSTCDLEDLSTEIIDFLVQLKLINKEVEWSLQAAINKACIFSQNDNSTSNIDSIVYVKKISTPKKTEKTTFTINYKESANLQNNQKESQVSGRRSEFFQSAKPQQTPQSDLNSDKSFRS
jgi:hypothetical protein